MSKQTSSLVFNGLRQKAKDYHALLKVRLSLLVVFSAAMGYALGAGMLFSWVDLVVLCLGGFFLTGASNALNQVFERDYDRMMKRTSSRPLPSGRMDTQEAVLAAGLMSVAGILLLATFNPLSALFGALSLLLYAFVYTPMKRVSPIAVIIGAIPGAFPPLIGWVAATGTIGVEGLVVFGILFFWQMPHFWSIAWIAYEDYAKAGFHLLPSSGGRDKETGMQCIIFAVLLIPVSLATYMIGSTGLVSAVVVGLTGGFYAWKAFKLYLKCDRKSALGLMFASFAYVPVVLIALVADNI